MHYTDFQKLLICENSFGRRSFQGMPSDGNTGPGSRLIFHFPRGCQAVFKVILTYTCRE